MGKKRSENLMMVIYFHGWFVISYAVVSISAFVVIIDLDTSFSVFLVCVGVIPVL